MTAPTAARRFWAVVLLLFAVATCAALGLLSYSFYETYGPDSFSATGGLLTLGVSALPFVAIASVIAGGAAVIGLRLIGRRPRLLSMIGLSVLLSVAITMAGAWFGAEARHRQQDRAAAACSPDERTALEALGSHQQDGFYGTGHSDGSCRGTVSFAPNDDAGVTALRARLVAAGWVLTGSPDAPKTTYVKDGKTLEVTVVKDKDIEVTLSFPA